MRRKIFGIASARDSNMSIALLPLYHHPASAFRPQAWGPYTPGNSRRDANKQRENALFCEYSQKISEVNKIRCSFLGGDTSLQACFFIVLETKFGIPNDIFASRL